MIIIKLLQYLKELDCGDPFKMIVDVEVDAYDPGDILEVETNPPSLSPIKAPAEPVQVMKTNDAVIEVKEGSLPRLWWVWLLVALVILVLLCAAWVCIKHRIEDERNKQRLNMYIVGGDAMTSTKSAWTRRATYDTSESTLRASSRDLRRAQSSRAMIEAGNKPTRTRRATYDTSDLRAQSSRDLRRAQGTRDLQRAQSSRNMINQSSTRRLSAEQNGRGRVRRATVQWDDDGFAMNGGLDPPGDQNAVVPYHSTSNHGNERMSRNVVPRDPTLFIDEDSY